MGYIKDKYDVTLTQSIWDSCVDEQSDTYYTYSLTPVCVTGFTDTSSQCQEEDNYVNYHNFQAITNVSFLREVHNGPGAPEVFSCMSGTSMTNVELVGHTVAILGDGVPITGLTFTNGGFVVITEEDTSVRNIKAYRDFDGIEIDAVTGGTASVSGATVAGNMGFLDVESGGVVTNVVVSRNLASATIGKGAIASGVSAGLQGAMESEGSEQFGQATVMNVLSGGSAMDLYLGCGGVVNVSSGGSVSGLKLGAVNASGVGQDEQPWSVTRGGVLNVNGGSVSNAVVSGTSDASGVVDGTVNVSGSGRIDGLSGFAKLNVADGVVASADVMSGAAVSLGQGGVLSGAQVHSGAKVEIFDGGAVLGGTMSLGGMIVAGAAADASTLTVTFDLTEWKWSIPPTEALIDNLANLQGVTLSTIMLDPVTAMGNSYVLAMGSDGFDGTLTVTTGGETTYQLKPGESVVAEDVTSPTEPFYSETMVFSLENDSYRGLVFSVEPPDAEVTGVVAAVDGMVLPDGEWANEPITLTVEVNEYTWEVYYMISPDPYSIDGWIKMDDDHRVTLSEYCEVGFVARSTNGRRSDIYKYTVNYDDVAPVISDLKADSGAAVLPNGEESEVSVLVTDDLDETPKLEVSVGGGNWSQAARGDDGRYHFAVTGGAGFTLRATDHASNSSELVLTVPAAPVASADITTLTNEDVTVTAEFDDDSTVQEYSLDGDKWLAYDKPVVLEENGTVWFRDGAFAGYSEAFSVIVDNIDRTPPTDPSDLKADVSYRTVTLSWTASVDELAGVKEYIVNYGHDDKAFTVTTTGTEFVLEYADFATWRWSVQAVDNLGNASAVAEGEDFTVVAPPQNPNPKGDVDGDGLSDVLFARAEDGVQGYWLSGPSEWRSTGTAHPSDWVNLGGHDFSGDGRADTVMVGSVMFGSVKAASVGYYEDGDDADGWVSIGYLGGIGDTDWRNQVGNLTGAGDKSIVWYAPGLYALGAWLDGTSEWRMLSNGFGGDAWTVAGCGDFDGDGRDSVLMAFNGCMTFYSVGINGTESSMGSLNWAGWELSAIGDFAGDGRDDLVLFYQPTGSVVLLADGNLDDWAAIGQLDASDWFAAGCCDYDGDGADDLLVRQTSTGLLGYYASGDFSKWTELGEVDTTWTVIA